jgi:hypothetical protein
MVERGATKVARLELLPLKAYVTLSEFKLITLYVEFSPTVGHHRVLFSG